MSGRFAWARCRRWCGTLPHPILKVSSIPKPSISSISNRQPSILDNKLQYQRWKNNLNIEDSSISKIKPLISGSDMKLFDIEVEWFDIVIWVIRYWRSHFIYRALYQRYSGFNILDIEDLNLRYRKYWRWIYHTRYRRSSISKVTVLHDIKSLQTQSILKTELLYWKSFSEFRYKRIKLQHWTLKYCLILKFKFWYWRGNFDHDIKGIGPAMYVLEDTASTVRMTIGHLFSKKGADEF